MSSKSDLSPYLEGKSAPPPNERGKFSFLVYAWVRLGAHGYASLPDDSCAHRGVSHRHRSIHIAPVTDRYTSHRWSRSRETRRERERERDTWTGANPAAREEEGARPPRRRSEPPNSAERHCAVVRGREKERRGGSRKRTVPCAPPHSTRAKHGEMDRRQTASSKTHISSSHLTTSSAESNLLRHLPIFMMTAARRVRGANCDAPTSNRREQDDNKTQSRTHNQGWRRKGGYDLCDTTNVPARL